ncbi:anti-sigma factor, putative [Babesia ovata]|uniref:Anti-sigma factor, putative n=1 Tax=Babesia ovata TaxID=189622 RepID=A0A2H6K6Q8_9APIC|nr:anti-sigma factor, putative [Babesia ovata]GBE58684.1 anti-sigma factor, putative [Babesia ovata]
MSLYFAIRLLPAGPLVLRCGPLDGALLAALEVGVLESVPIKRSVTETVFLSRLALVGGLSRGKMGPAPILIPKTDSASAFLAGAPVDNEPSRLVCGLLAVAFVAPIT